MNQQSPGVNPYFGQFQGGVLPGSGAGVAAPGGAANPAGIPSLDSVQNGINKLTGQANAYTNSAAALDSVVSPDQLEALNIAQQNLALSKNMYQLTARATQDFLKTTLQVAQGWFA